MSTVEDELEMGEQLPRTEGGPLYRDPALVQAEREDFLPRLKKLGRSSTNKRPLYEEMIDIIGANGILDGIEELWPKCHSEAHALGSVIQAREGNIGTALRVCGDGCYSGCMHGVLMEVFSAARNPDDPQGHIDLTLLKSAMQEVCFTNETMLSLYSPGDCAHGVGHAMMFLVDYAIPQAIALCEILERPAMVYYCATGAYMEYMGEREKEDAKKRSLLYPCDTYKYPAACARYKMIYVLRRHLQKKRPIEELINECERLEGKFRLGCFHGLGNSFMGRIRTGRFSIKEICLEGTKEDQFFCIEGAMERMAKYYEKRAREVCKDLQEGQNRKTCLTAVDHRMYNMEKDLTLYLAD